MRTLLLKIALRAQALQSRLIAWLLGRHATAIVARTEQGLFALDPRDRGVGRQLLLRGSYAKDELSRLNGYLPEGGSALIVGGHVGALAIPLARRCRDITVVEPNPRSNELLRINMLLNGITHCQVLDVAASDRHGAIEMLISTANSGGSKRMPVRHDPLYTYDKPQVIRVPAVPLDEELRRHDFDLIVMDIEGSEYFALQGMQSILKASRALAIEFLPHHLRNVGGVTVERFLAVIAPHFSSLTVPSKSLTVGAERFLGTLADMYAADEGDDGIIFSK